MTGDPPILVLGIGNILLRDDGIGVHVADALRDDPALGRDVRVVDGGTSGLALLPLIAEARALVLVDAVEVGAEPGSIQVIHGDRLFADAAHLSVHEVGAADLLAAARMTDQLPERVVLVGVQPDDLSAGVTPTEPVRAAVPAAAATVRAWCQLFAGACHA